MKTKSKPISGSVKVEPDVLITAKEICKEKGWLIQPYITSAVRAMNDKIKSKK
jgi:hypothetical protein